MIINRDFKQTVVERVRRNPVLAMMLVDGVTRDRP
jgi:hypothetical protein